MNITPGYVVGSTTIHALRRIGMYPSGAPRYVKICAASGRDNHDPAPAPGATVTCKRCLAKLATHDH